MEWWQICLSTEDRKVLFSDDTATRAAVRSLVRVAGSDLLLFCIVDEHVHLVVEADRPRAGRLAQAIALALRPGLVAPLDSAFFKLVVDRSHLWNLTRYVITQPSHHGLRDHPALWTGSCVLDLLGARWIDGFQPGLHRAMPRLGAPDFLEILGLSRRPLEPLASTMLPTAMHQIRDAASAAACICPDLGGNQPDVVRMRAAATHLGIKAGYKPVHVAETLGMSIRTVQRILAQAPCQEASSALLVRLALEARVRDSM